MPAKHVGQRTGKSRKKLVSECLEGEITLPGSWKLGRDWRFSEIEKQVSGDPRFRWFAGRKVVNPANHVVEALHALEDALFRVHPDVPKRALGDFWMSDQVGRFVADRFNLIWKDPNVEIWAKRLWNEIGAGTGFHTFREQLLNEARGMVWERLNAYVDYGMSVEAVEPKSRDHGRIPLSEWDPAKFRKARTDRGESQEKASLHFQVGVASVGRWERGESRPYKKHLPAIRAYLDPSKAMP